MRVIYVQPYVPTYRVPLFSRLSELLDQNGGTLTVAASPPDSSMKLRRDCGTGPWLRYVSTTRIPTPIGEVRYRNLRSILRDAPDVVVMELDPANLNAWLTVARGRVPLVLWGHGRTFTAPERPTSAAARAFLARRAQHVMTYTERGRQSLIARAVRPDKVSTVGNSTDTTALRQALTRRKLSDMNASEAFGIPIVGRRVFVYAGGLDSDKRISFLAQAASHAHSMDPRFLLLVAGSGADEYLLDKLAPIVRRIHRARLSELADMLAISEGIWMPGRIGLIAVDALAAGRPIHTTPFPYHAPEFDFLTVGRDVFIHDDDPRRFAEASLGHRARDLSDSADATGGMPSVESVSARMLAVLQKTLHHQPQRLSRTISGEDHE